MERLTEKHYAEKGYYMKCSETCEKRSCDTCDSMADIVDRLGEYEDAEEQGLLVRLPCTVGELVWVCYPKFKRITRVVYMAKSDILDDVECGAIICRTREEAEAALKGEDEYV